MIESFGTEGKAMILLSEDARYDEAITMEAVVEKYVKVMGQKSFQEICLVECTLNAKHCSNPSQPFCTLLASYPYLNLKALYLLQKYVRVGIEKSWLLIIANGLLIIIVHIFSFNAFSWCLSDFVLNLICI